MREAQRQAVLGIMTCGIEILPLNQQPPKDLLLQWIGQEIQIEKQNSRALTICEDVVSCFERDGFDCCILKGQANLRYYPEEMKSRRSCGDIDVWTVPKSGGKRKVNTVRKVLKYVEEHHIMTALCWLHCGYLEDCGMSVEVHFRPSFMNDPFRNRRFLMHFASINHVCCREVIEGKELPVMKVDDDAIFQMNHIYRHLIDEGVGLRQVVDFYWLIHAWNKQHICTKEDTMRIVASMGMKRFAGALMCVLRDVCGIREDLLLCPANDDDGRFLINEIMLAGNFGHDDPRMADLELKKGFGRQLNQAWRRFKRNLRFILSYPGEVIWEPIARCYHFAWKKMKLWNWGF